MLKYFLFIVSLLCVSGSYAQRNIIESLQTRRAGEGVVTVHQDAQITSLIGKRYVRSTSSEPVKTLKARGFRVQVYAGNNSRQARSEANNVAAKVKEEFPDLPVYTYFSLHVGCAG